MIIFLTMEPTLYSVRMRASSRGGHLSGGERIVPHHEVDVVVSALTQRALSAAGDAHADISCSVEALDMTKVNYAKLPDLLPMQVTDYRDGRKLAQSLLDRSGVTQVVAAKAVQLLAAGPGPGGKVMRGAVIMHAVTGQRLELDPERGVRVSRMDLTPGCRKSLEESLHNAGLGHRRVIEALVLSAKVTSAPGIVAELCWSDDPAYTAGYVAAPGLGYRRISAMKAQGDPLGGRVFFVNPSKVQAEDFVSYLEKQPVLFEEMGMVCPAEAWSGDNA